MTTTKQPEPELEHLEEFSATDAGTIAFYLDCLKLWPAIDGEPQPVALKTLTAAYCFPPDAAMNLDELLARVGRLQNFGLVDRISEVPTVFHFHAPSEAQLLLFLATFRLAAEQLLVSDLILSGGYALRPTEGNVEGAQAFLAAFRACLAKLEEIAPGCPWLPWIKAGGHNDPATTDGIELAAALFNDPPSYSTAV